METERKDRQNQCVWVCGCVCVCVRERERERKTNGEAGRLQRDFVAIFIVNKYEKA